MGMKRALTTAYHPQADGQTEIMNQMLEISLRAYIGPNQDNWVSSLDGLALSYNSTPHTATEYFTLTHGFPWSPHRVYVESTRTPWRLHVESVRTV